MGYYTTYRLSVVEPNDSATLDKVGAFIKKHQKKFYPLIGDHGYYKTESVKWYDHEKDMAWLSVAFPEILFKLEGEGEENGDLWHKYFKAGKIQVCKARIVFDDYDPQKAKRGNFKIDPITDEDFIVEVPTVKLRNLRNE